MYAIPTGVMVSGKRKMSERGVRPARRWLVRMARPETQHIGRGGADDGVDDRDQMVPGRPPSLNSDCTMSHRNATVRGPRRRKNEAREMDAATTQIPQNANATMATPPGGRLPTQRCGRLQGPEHVRLLGAVNRMRKLVSPGSRYRTHPDQIHPRKGEKSDPINGKTPGTARREVLAR